MLIENPEPAAVVSAIHGVAPGAWIATDADGTLWDGDVGDDVMRCAAADPTGWAAPDVDLEAYLARLEVDYHGACRHAADVAHRAPPEVARPALRAFLVPRLRLRRYLVDALLEAARRGVSVYVVSASPRLAVEVALGLFELGGMAIIALEHDEAGRFVEPASIGDGKVDAWRVRGLPAPALAFGDSRWDLPLLHSAGLGMRLLPAATDPHRDRAAALFTPA